MYQEVRTELKVFENELFTGHVKFNLEAGKIVLEAFTTKIELDELVEQTTEWDKTFRKLYAENKNFYGSIEFNLKFGKVISFTYSVALKGDDLKKRLEKNKCNTVKYVVKKLDT